MMLNNTEETQAKILMTHPGGKVIFSSLAKTIWYKYGGKKLSTYEWDLYHATKDLNFLTLNHLRILHEGRNKILERN